MKSRRTLTCAPFALRGNIASPLHSVDAFVDVSRFSVVAGFGEQSTAFCANSDVASSVTTHGQYAGEETHTMAEALPSNDNQPKKRVRFSSLLISYTAVASSLYDRTAVESDVFSCDVCGIQIPAGMKGFEPYGTCPLCPDGFDACGACCGTAALMALCRSTPYPSQATMEVSCHEHALRVVDRKAEIDWANGNAVGGAKQSSPKKRTPTKKGGTKRSPRSRSKSPRSNKRRKT